jgi:ABC-type xylose transport system permease subunit
VTLVLVATVTLIDPDRGLPVPVVIALVVTALLAGVARLTRFGRSLFAAGGNPVAAELAGISTRRVTLAVFGMMGALYAIAGMILIARIDGAPPDGASPLELDAIAAAVIGGTSLAGGTGSVSGAVLGAVLLASVSNGLDLVGVQSFWQLVATGAILIVAVLADVRLRGRA